MRRRLAVLLHRDQFARDLEEEIQSHLELQTRDNQQAGLSPADARHAARRQFGNSTLLAEAGREVWTWSPLEHLVQDLQYAGRGLRRNPAFALVAILSLALGIGANTAIFTVVDAVLLRTLPVHDPGQLAILQSATDAPIHDLSRRNSNDRTDAATGRSVYNTFPLSALRDFRIQAADALDTFAFYSPGIIGISENTGSRPAFLTLISGNFFTGLGVPMALGRPLVESDDQSGATAIVLTHAFWKRAFHADPAVLGKLLRLNGAPMTVVGVTSPAFYGISAAGFDGPADVFAPLAAMETIVPEEFRASGKPKTASDYWWIQIMARRSPNVTAEAAASRLTAIFQATLAASGVSVLQQARNPHILVTPGDKGLSPLRDEVQRSLLLMSGVVGAVLLLACVNIATLQLARSTARHKEIAVRLSLGAGHGRIIRQLLIESLLLSALGALLGMLLAAWGAPWLARLLTSGPFFTTVWLDLSPDLRVFTFTLLATALTSLLFGLAPVWQATKVDITSNLKDNTHAATPRSSFRMGRILIAGQVALSLLLLTGSGLFLRTLWNLYRVDGGFARDHVLLFHLDLGQLGFKPAQTGPLYNSILESIQNVPGVRAAAAMSHALIGGWRNSTELSSAHTHWQPVEVLLNTVSPDFFTTMRMPLIAGRPFASRDSQAARLPVILNESAAAQLCGTEAPIGQIIRQHAGAKPFEAEVIGVSRDAKFNSLRRPIQPTVFIPFRPSYSFTARTFAVRTSADPLSMVASVRHAIAAVNPNLPMTEVKTQTQLIDESLHQERLFTSLLTLFAASALLLAAIGLHGVTAYSVARRTAEIGIRVALGARRGHILALILSQVLAPVSIGALLGFLASLAATRWIASLLFGVTRFDPLTLIAALILLTAVALASAFAPAWRAARANPVAALRAE